MSGRSRRRQRQQRVSQTALRAAFRRRWPQGERFVLWSTDALACVPLRPLMSTGTRASRYAWPFPSSQ